LLSLPFTFVDIAIKNRLIKKNAENALLFGSYVELRSGHMDPACFAMFTMLKALLQKRNADDARGKHTIALILTIRNAEYSSARMSSI
jgi:hypothetical protein